MMISLFLQDQSNIEEERKLLAKIAEERSKIFTLKFELESKSLRDKLILVDDTLDWQRSADFNGLERVGGFDISFLKGDETLACASFVVLSFPDLEILHSTCEVITIDAPYIPGYLAFREGPPLIDMFQKFQAEVPELVPQVILIDGNGVLHSRGFGLACHVGLNLALPTIGVAKNLFQVDGLAKDGEHKRKIDKLDDSSDCFPLIGLSGDVLGMALRSTSNTRNPVYVSVGNLISLTTAVGLVRACCLYRVPEPIRQADIISRAYLREHFPDVPPPVRRTPHSPIQTLIMTAIASVVFLCAVPLCILVLLLQLFHWVLWAGRTIGRLLLVGVLFQLCGLVSVATAFPSQVF